MNKFINTTLQLKDENIIFEDKVDEGLATDILQIEYGGELISVDEVFKMESIH